MSGKSITIRALLAAGLLAAASACANVKDQLGIVKDPPDEFRVTSRAPLSLPPEYTLRPPRPGEARPQQGTTQQQARQSVFRLSDEKPAYTNGAAAGEPRSPGEQAFLAAAGAGQGDPNIRQIVDQETDRKNAEEESFIEYIVFWREPEPHGEIVDASAESERLRNNASLGKQATDGQTPTITRRERAILEGFFDSLF